MVMYAGCKVEEAPVAETVPRSPAHPYTQGLPRRGAQARLFPSPARRGALAEIPGQVPSLKKKIEGCVFAGRCSLATDLCRQFRAGSRREGSPVTHRRLPLRRPQGGGRGMRVPLPPGQ